MDMVIYNLILIIIHNNKLLNKLYIVIDLMIFFNVINL